MGVVPTWAGKPAVEARRAQRARQEGDEEPILLVMSDNGPQTRAGTTRVFWALCSISAHFGRPGTPTDQAWIETLSGHVDNEWPRLDKITVPNMLRAVLDDVRNAYHRANYQHKPWAHPARAAQSKLPKRTIAQNHHR